MGTDKQIKKHKWTSNLIQVLTELFQQNMTDSGRPTISIRQETVVAGDITRQTILAEHSTRIKFHAVTLSTVWALNVTRSTQQTNDDRNQQQSNRDTALYIRMCNNKGHHTISLAIKIHIIINTIQTQWNNTCLVF